MNKRTMTLAATAAGAAIFLAACGSSTSSSSPSSTTMAPSTSRTSSDMSKSDMPTTVVAVAQSSPDHKILVEAVTAAGLAGTLSGSGPFTVLAPTDEAFAAAAQKLGVTKEQLLANPALGDILKYHVIPGKVMSTDLKNGPVTTVQGEAVTVSTSPPSFNGAKVVKADIESGNGVVHVIDAVILPPTIAASLGVG